MAGHLFPRPFYSCEQARCAVALRPRKNKSRQNKYHRCQRCGGRVRKRSFRCKKCSEGQR